MPVVGDDDRGGRLGRGEPAQRRADQEEDEGEQPADDVQPVEAGRQEEHRAVAGGRDRVAVVDLQRVLTRLAGDEDQAHEEREGEPAAQLVDVAALGREHAVLAGHAGEHQHDRERQGVERDAVPRSRLMALPSGRRIGQSCGWAERTVKYIANRPAKNISSLESQTMVPTLTMFGRVSECTLLDSKAGAAVDVTRALLRERGGQLRRGGLLRSVVWCARAAVGPIRSGMSAPIGGPEHAGRPAARSSVILYSHDGDFRARMRTAVGRRPAPDVARIDWVECATSAQVIEQIDLGDIDLLVLDGESQPTGGMGLARQFKYEIDDCPPVLVVANIR